MYLPVLKLLIVNGANIHVRAYVRTGKILYLSATFARAQMNEPRMTSDLSGMSYEERREALDLPTL